MFTAQQLFEILVNKDDASLRADGQPSNRAATLLYALWEGYRDERPRNQPELDFANALDRMMDTSESSAGFLKGVPNAENIFASTFGRFVDDFRRAYDALPKEIKEQEKIDQIAVEVEALSARKAEEAEKAASEIKEEVKEEIKEEAPEETGVIEEGPPEEEAEKDQLETNEAASEIKEEVQEEIEEEAPEETGVIEEKPLEGAEKEQPETNEAASAVKEDNREKIKEKYKATMDVIEEAPEEEVDQEQLEPEKDASIIKEEVEEEIKKGAPEETGVIEEGPAEEEADKEQLETNEAASAVKEDNREKIKEKHKATMDVIEEAPAEEEVDQEQPEINEAASAVKETGSQAQNGSESDGQKLNEPEQSVKTPKDRFEEEMRNLTELFYTEYERYHLYKEKESAARNGDNAEEISKNASEREKAEKRLKDDLATIVVMDQLRQYENWNAALNRSELNKRKEELRGTNSFGTLWGFVDKIKLGMASLVRSLRSFTSADLADRLVKAEETVTERREQAAAAVSQTEMQKPEAKETFDKLSKELAESTAKIFETVIQLRDETHPWQQEGSPLSAEELKDLVAVNNENLKANIAALVAMDNFRAAGKFEAAADPDQLESATNKILESTGIETVMTAILSTMGEEGPKNLTDLFQRIDRRELSDLFAGVEKPALNGQTQKNEEKAQGPEKKPVNENKEQGPEKKPENRELTEADSPIRRFQAGLKKLQEEVKAYDSGKARLNIAESRKGILKLLALREMGADQNIGPNTPVSDQEVRDRMHAILQKKGDGHSLYRAVYDCLKSEYKIGKVVAAIQGGEPTKEFRSKLMNAAELKPKEKETKKEASVGPNPVKQ